MMRKGYLKAAKRVSILRGVVEKERGWGKMNVQYRLYRQAAGMAALVGFVLAAGTAVSAIKNMAVVVSADSKLPDVTLAELTKLCKGA